MSVSAFGVKAPVRQRKKTKFVTVCTTASDFYSAKLIPVESAAPLRVRRPMLTLFHHPLCPHSRYVRLILGEYGIAARLVEERFWERREEFLLLNPAAELPVLVAEGEPPIPGAEIVAEYIEETHQAQNGEDRLLPPQPRRRVEVRRLANWFNDKFHAEVSGPLVNERVFKRHMTQEQGAVRPILRRCAQRVTISAIILAISVGSCR